MHRSYVWMLASVMLAGGAAMAADFYVASDGKDSNPGTVDKPFATPEQAREAVRQIKANGDTTATTVYLRQGTYLREATLSLTGQDSGTKDARVIYRAYGDEAVRLVGGRVVPASAFKAVSDSKLLDRMDPSARGKVVQLDLATSGLKHIGPFPPMFTGNGGLFELFFNNQRMTISRWPNDGYATIKEVLDSGIKPQPHGGSFVYRGQRPTRWQTACQQGQLWIAGFWRVPWVIQAIRVQSHRYGQAHHHTCGPDLDRHWLQVHPGSERHPQGRRKGTVVCAEPAGRDRPARRMVHRLLLQDAVFLAAGGSGQVHGPDLIADMETPIISLQDASCVTLRGLTIEGGLGDAVRIEGGRDNLIAACTIRNTARNGISIEGGTNNGAKSCDLYNLGAEGISVGGGDRRTLTAAGNFAINNHIHHYGQVQKIVSGINISGVGNHIAHNLIHDGTYGGIVYHGNDHVMELNEIHNIGLDGGDLGAFYSSSDWASRGNMIRHNFIHHAPNANGSYMDDGHSGDLTIGNVMYRISRRRGGPVPGRRP